MHQAVKPSHGMSCQLLTVSEFKLKLGVKKLCRRRVKCCLHIRVRSKNVKGGTWLSKRHSVQPGTQGEPYTDERAGAPNEQIKQKIL